MKKMILTALWFALPYMIAAGRPADDVLSSIVDSINRQVALFPQEKIYLHTDKNHYISGDTIWFRAHLLDAATHREDSTSRYIYIDLLDPSSRLYKTVTVRRENGIHSGHLILPPEAAEGYYILRAYTHFMKNLPWHHFAHKRLLVSDPAVAGHELSAEFRKVSAKGDMSVRFSVFDRFAGENIRTRKINMWLNNKVISHHDVSINQQGEVTVWFRYQPEIEPNILTVEYDNHYKFLLVPDPQDHFKLDAAPEGRVLIPGTRNRIFITATDLNRNPLQLPVEIRENGERIVAEITTDRHGTAVAEFVPVEGNNYSVHAVNPAGTARSVELPSSRAASVGLGVERTEAFCSVYCRRASGRNKEEPMYLVLYSRGRILYAEPWPPSVDTLLFPIREIPDGIVTAWLFDGEKNLLSSRTFFNEMEQQARVRIDTDDQTYGTREKVTVRVLITDTSGTPIDGSFSVSVTADEDIDRDSEENILTALLFSAESPLYLEKTWEYDAEQFDRAVGGSPYSRYRMESAAVGDFALPVYPMEMSQEIRGRVMPLAGKKGSANAEVVYFSPLTRISDYTTTDAEGYFHFKGFEITDEDYLIVLATNEKGKKNVRLRIDERPYLPPVRYPFIPYENTHEEYSRKAIYNYFYPDEEMRTYHLEEITVTGRRRRVDQSIFSGTSNYTFDAAKFKELGIKYPHDLYHHINGAFIDRGQHTIHLAPNWGPAKIMVNGELFKYTDFCMLDLSQITLIEVVKNRQITFPRRVKGFEPFTPVMAPWGLIDVITKETKPANGTRRSPSYNVASVTHLGYQPPVRYHPVRYDEERSENIGSDVRTTVYWNEHLTTGEKGYAEFEFFTTDQGGTYTLLVEGVVRNGMLIHRKEKINVKPQANIMILTDPNELLSPKN